MGSSGDSKGASSPPTWVERANRYALIAAGVATAVGALGVAVYLIQPGSDWTQAWVPEIAGGLLLGALTILVLDVVIKNEIEEAHDRHMEPLRLAAAQEIDALRTRADHFIGMWNYYIDVVEADGDFQSAGSRDPDISDLTRFFSQLSERTRDVLRDGDVAAARFDGSTTHDGLTALCADFERRSNRIVQWYGVVLDPAVPPALGRLQECFLVVVDRLSTGEYEFPVEPDFDFASAHRTAFRSAARAT